MHYMHILRSKELYDNIIYDLHLSYLWFWDDFDTVE